MLPSRIVLFAALTAGLVVTAGTATVAEPPVSNHNASKSATLLYFNDAHDIRPVLTGAQDRGGVARLATVINTVRDARPDTRVVFGGDLAGGTLLGGLYKGFPMVDAFNDIGIDLANFGQHDFDFGVENARQLVAASEFPWISSNLMDANGEPFAPGGTYREMRVGKIDIGFLGLTDALETSSAGSGIQQLDTVASAKAAVTAMQGKSRPDVIIAVTQMPLDANRELLAQVPQIDAVLTEEMAEYDSVITDVGGTFVMAPEGNMGSMIRLDITRASGGYTVTPFLRSRGRPHSHSGPATEAGRGALRSRDPGQPVHAAGGPANTAAHRRRTRAGDDCRRLRRGRLPPLPRHRHRLDERWRDPGRRDRRSVHQAGRLLHGAVRQQGHEGLSDRCRDPAGTRGRRRPGGHARWGFPAGLRDDLRLLAGEPGRVAGWCHHRSRLPHSTRPGSTQPR